MNNFWKISTLVLTVFVVLSVAVSAALLSKKTNDKVSNNNTSNPIEISPVEPVFAKEIYPLFECPCCGKPIDQCTCPMAKERKNYVDALVEVSQDISEDGIVLAYIKKYGLSSFMDEEKKKEFREKLAKDAPADRPIIILSPEEYNFGDVRQKEGITTTLFELKNEGKSDLIIERIETSCGCTSASIVYKDKEGPKFSMSGHGVNEDIGEWQLIIAPGDMAQLKVYYDPNVHKDFRGTAIREISIFSNDPIDFEKKVKIELNQVQ